MVTVRERVLRVLSMHRCAALAPPVRGTSDSRLKTAEAIRGKKTILGYQRFITPVVISL